MTTPRNTSGSASGSASDARRNAQLRPRPTGWPVGSFDSYVDAQAAVDKLSDEEFDVLSPRSGMFSPSIRNSHLDDDPFEVGSQHESEVSWASVGRRSPSPHL